MAGVPSARLGIWSLTVETPVPRRALLEASAPRPRDLFLVKSGSGFFTFSVPLEHLSPAALASRGWHGPDSLPASPVAGKESSMGAISPGRAAALPLWWRRALLVGYRT
jgi:hypothetical protein